jgi:histidyl-tRNA synthetase
VGEAAQTAAAKLAEDLRRAGFTVDLGYGGNVGKRMKRADKLGAVAAVLLGEDELAKGVATLRDLASGAQEQVALGKLQDRLAAYRR